MAKNQYQLVTFFLNGKEVERMIDVRASLTSIIRSTSLPLRKKVTS